MMNRLLSPFILVGLMFVSHSAEFVVGQEKNEKDDAAPRELAELQGTWNFVFYEEKGVAMKPGTRQFVISDKSLTYRSSNLAKAETTIEIDPTTKQKELTQKFTDGKVSQCIYVLADNYLLLCGHRDKAKRPTMFSCGANDGGEFLILLKKQP